jgi:hypothetical protein
MPYRPLSFTKNLGGLEHLHEAIRLAYVPGTTVNEFEARLPARLASRRLVIVQFFLATRLIGRTEYVVEDALIRTTLSQAFDVTLARLYLFALLLNLPGQRLKREYRSPAPAQNEYARVVLHDSVGWRAAGVDVGSILPWVKRNVQGSGGLRKFATNLVYFFEQGQFDVDPTGHLITYGNNWAPLALQLFFDRFRIHMPSAEVDDLVFAARQHEVHRLMGLDYDWLNSVIDGAALTYLSPMRHSLVATQETATERSQAPRGPAGRQTVLIQRLIRSTRNKLLLEAWYEKTCQICGLRLEISDGEPSIDYGHIQPLGAPHNGWDGTENMLSLCPNHHRQLDRGGITIEPATLRIIAPYGSCPTPRDTLLKAPEHVVADVHLEYHRNNIFNR